MVAALAMPDILTSRATFDDVVLSSRACVRVKLVVFCELELVAGTKLVGLNFELLLVVGAREKVLRELQYFGLPLWPEVFGTVVNNDTR